jgi:hypothetical protein
MKLMLGLLNSLRVQEKKTYSLKEAADILAAQKLLVDLNVTPDVRH